MNDYIRSALLELNTGYQGYSFEIEEFANCVLLWCRYRISELDTILMKTRIMHADLSYEKIMKEGKRLMNKINQDELRTVVGCVRNLIDTNSCLDIRPMSINKYSIAPKELIFQDEKTTIINWTDGTKTIVKCSDDDVFSPEAGIALCYMKKFITDNDSERFHRILKSLISVSKFKNSKKNDIIGQVKDIFGIASPSNAFIKLYTEEENHDVNTGASDNSGDNDSDGSTMEVE